MFCSVYSEAAICIWSILGRIIAFLWFDTETSYNLKTLGLELREALLFGLVTLLLQKSYNVPLNLVR